MKTIKVHGLQKSEPVIGFISAAKGFKNQGKYEARLNSAGAYRRNVHSIGHAWLWINRSTGGNARKLSTEELLGYGSAE